ncbi:MAG: hypothetical protein K2M39_10720 [Muribaculaceae bacterium]|nr:hypothetical protein [Muribaculaceae bacterium]
MQQILVPIFICAIMPIAIVFITMVAKVKSEQQRANIIIKAIEENNNIDADKLAETLNRPRRTPLQILNLRLLRGCIFTLIGIGLCVISILVLCDGGEFGQDSVFFPMVSGFAIFSIGVSYLIVYFVTRKQVEMTEDSNN